MDPANGKIAQASKPNRNTHVTVPIILNVMNRIAANKAAITTHMFSRNVSILFFI